MLLTWVFLSMRTPWDMHITYARWFITYKGIWCTDGHLWPMRSEKAGAVVSKEPIQWRPSISQYRSTPQYRSYCRRTLPSSIRVRNSTTTISPMAQICKEAISTTGQRSFPIKVQQEREESPSHPLNPYPHPAPGLAMKTRKTDRLWHSSNLWEQ